MEQLQGPKNLVEMRSLLIDLIGDLHLPSPSALLEKGALPLEDEELLHAFSNALSIRDLENVTSLMIDDWSSERMIQSDHLSYSGLDAVSTAVDFISLRYLLKHPDYCNVDPTAILFGWAHNDFEALRSFSPSLWMLAYLTMLECFDIFYSPIVAPGSVAVQSDVGENIVPAADYGEFSDPEAIEALHTLRALVSEKTSGLLLTPPPENQSAE